MRPERCGGSKADSVDPASHGKDFGSEMRSQRSGMTWTFMF